MTRREALLLTLFALIVAFVFMRGCDKHIDRQTANTSLPVNDVEKLVFNPSTHQLIVVTPGKEEKLFLPDRPSSVEITKAGAVNIVSKQYGTELKPFLGVEVSNAPRLAAGLDLVYYKKLDLGIGFGGQVGMHTPVAFVKLSYTVYDNTSLGLAFDSSSHAGVVLSVRL